MNIKQEIISDVINIFLTVIIMAGFWIVWLVFHYFRYGCDVPCLTDLVKVSGIWVIVITLIVHLVIKPKRGRYSNIVK